MEIIAVNENNKEEVVNFLKNISLVHDINEEVVMNGEYVLDGEIVGLLSFEEFNRIGLVRYFIFKKEVKEKVILELFRRVVEKAARKGIRSLLSLVVKKEAASVFKGLGFHEIAKDDVYIDETMLNQTKFKEAFVLKYDIPK
ncbi:MAG TPA: hypothetical protein GYA05_03760 [Acholeplasmataceae bacterium]|nr:hypothetical protein [Acholeplasmataceae bacterium]